MTRIWLDTDIGTDVDDCLALAFILNSDEYQVEGISCVYGDVDLRAQIALKLLQWHGTNIPVYTGARQAMKIRQPIYWEGHEGEGILGDDEPLPIAEGFAPEVIVRTVMDNPNEIHLACIAPLTNLALALSIEPRIAQNVAHITIMGGVSGGLSRLDLPIAEHNIQCDPDSAHIVFSSGAPMTLIPLDITTQVQITKADVSKLQAVNHPFHRAVVGQIERYPRYIKQGWTNVHDPLAVASVIRPDVMNYQPVKIDVETNGRVGTGATFMQEAEDSNIRVAVSVDKAQFEELFMERLVRQR